MSPDLHHLSGAYAVDALDEAERAQFEAHLAGCADCRAEVAELTEAAGALGALVEATPPAHLREDVLTGIRRVRPLPPSEQGPPGTEADPAPGVVVPFLRRTSSLLVAAAAVLALAVAGLVWQPWERGEPVLTAVEQVQQAPDVTTVATASGGVSAALAYSRSLGRSALTVDGLDPAPAGSTYQLWYLPSTGAPRPAGFLEVTGGSSSTALEGALGDAASVGVTLEPTGGSPAPTTEPVLVLGLG